MPLSNQLSHIEYLQVTTSNPATVFCGSDQEWFSTERQRLTGCGPSAAANILFYLNRKDDRSCCGRDRADLLDFMDDAWQSVTPESNGIPSTALFLEKLELYATRHDKHFRYFSLNVPSQQTGRPSLDYSEEAQTAQISICDEGITKRINLKLWLETTTQGGGFVYFVPDAVPSP